MLIFDDLRSEGNRSLFKTENIINLSKDLDVHNGHRSSAANFIKCTDGRFTEKFLCSLKLMSSRRSILESFMQCWLNITESCSFVLETCKFVKTFISLSLKCRHLCIGQIEASTCPPPPWATPRALIWLFWKLLFKLPPTRAKIPFKCPTLGSIQVIKCPHTPGTFHRHNNDRRTAETPSVVQQNIYK